MQGCIGIPRCSTGQCDAQFSLRCDGHGSYNRHPSLAGPIPYCVWFSPELATKKMQASVFFMLVS